MKCLYAVGAHFDSFTVDFGPLEVGIAFCLGGRIIMASQKNASCCHCCTLTAVFTFGCHNKYVECGILNAVLMINYIPYLYFRLILIP